MNYISRNIVKGLLLTSFFSWGVASDIPNSSEGEPELRQKMSQAAQQRRRNLKRYTSETGMRHAPMMLASDAEIEARYGEEVAAIEAADKKINKKKRKRSVSEEDLSLEDTDILIFTQDAVIAEKADGTEVILDDEPLREPEPKRPALNHRKPSMPKRTAGTSVHKNPDLQPNLAGTFIFYDSETTTLSPKCGGRFVELAAIKTIDGVPRETLHLLFNPDMKSWDGAFKAHGLHESYLRAQAPFYKVARYVEDFFGDDIRCAHNGFKFDDPYLNFEIKRARVFWQFRQMISPDGDFKDLAPRTSLLDKEVAEKGHAILKELGIVTDATPHENLEAKANSLTAAAMLYFFKDHMGQLDLGLKDDKKPGPMMFLNGNMLPDPDEYRENHEAAVARLAWFRLIRQDTDTYEQRAQLKQPYVKYIRDAIQTAEVYLSAAYRIFQDNILDEVAFRASPLDTAKMFDTLVYVRANQDEFARAVHVDNHKLDSLIDYYGLNRHARETGTHGAAIDTSLLYQVARKLLAASDSPAVTALLAKTQVEIEEFLFEKNSIKVFDADVKFVSTAQLHDDQIKGTTRDRNGRRVEPAMSDVAVPSYANLMTAQVAAPTALPAAHAQGQPFTGMPANPIPSQMPQMPQYGYPYGMMMQPQQMPYMQPHYPMMGYGFQQPMPNYIYPMPQQMPTASGYPMYPGVMQQPRP